MKQRARILSPELFMDEDIADALDIETRFFYAGLWTIADREGRLEDKPRRIKLYVCPYDNVDVEAKLSKLHETGYIIRYVVGDQQLIQIKPSAWKKYQSVHPGEAASKLPEITLNPSELHSISPTSTSTSTVVPTAALKLGEEMQYGNGGFFQNCLGHGKDQWLTDLTTQIPAEQIRAGMVSMPNYYKRKGLPKPDRRSARLKVWEWFSNEGTIDKENITKDEVDENGKFVNSKVPR